MKPSSLLFSIDGAGAAEMEVQVNHFIHFTGIASFFVICYMISIEKPNNKLTNEKSVCCSWMRIWKINK